jgi:hypothetical protein
MKKKGSAHLEIVTAFTLFIVFTIFLLYFLKAPEDTTIPTTILNELESSFLNSTTTELASFLVKPNQTGCVKFNISNLLLIGNSSVVSSGEMKSGWNADGTSWIVLDDGIRNSVLENGILTVNAQNINISENDTLEVFVSDAIFKGSGCPTTNTSSTIGTVTRVNAISEKKIRDFESNYSNNYTNLKDSFHLPTNVDFAIVSENFINATRNIPETDTQSKRLVMNVVFSDGSVTKKNIDLIVW